MKIDYATASKLSSGGSLWQRLGYTASHVLLAYLLWLFSLLNLANHLCILPKIISQFCLESCPSQVKLLLMSV
jgi:hypothetical protein